MCAKLFRTKAILESSVELGKLCKGGNRDSFENATRFRKKFLVLT